MNKGTFKDISFLGVLNWVTIQSQTEKYVEIISWWKNETCQSFPNSIKGVGKKSPVPVGGGRVAWEILVRVGIFSSGGENLLRSDFDHSNLFQS